MKSLNSVKLEGIILSEPEFSHSYKDKKFYSTTMSVKRLSGTEDIIPLIIFDDMVDMVKENMNKVFNIDGHYHSFNDVHSGTRKLKLFVLVKEIFIKEELENINQITLNGFICKQPNYRTTPSGKTITDVILAVNRNNHKSDYIPIIFWNSNAKHASELNVGDEIQVTGRIQSREYNKVIDDTTTVMTAYEVSVTSFKKIEE